MFSVKRFEIFRRKVTQNFSSRAFCLKADIKHYFQGINHEILLTIIKKKIHDRNFIWIVKRILENASRGGGGEQPQEIIRGCPKEIILRNFFQMSFLMS